MFKNYIEEEKLKSLVRCGVVTDGHIANYLQGQNYAVWAEGKDLAETATIVIGTDEFGNDITEEQLVNIYTPVDVSVAMDDWKAFNKLEKSYGLAYNSYMIPFKNEDAMAMLQVKAAFEMGLTATNIEFSNGTIMPMAVADFHSFALWFVEHRNGYFV